MSENDAVDTAQGAWSLSHAAEVQSASFWPGLDYSRWDHPPLKCLGVPFSTAKVILPNGDRSFYVCHAVVLCRVKASKAHQIRASLTLIKKLRDSVD